MSVRLMANYQRCSMNGGKSEDKFNIFVKYSTLLLRFYCFDLLHIVKMAQILAKFLQYRPFLGRLAMIPISLKAMTPSVLLYLHLFDNTNTHK